MTKGFMVLHHSLKILNIDCMTTFTQRFIRSCILKEVGLDNVSQLQCLSLYMYYLTDPKDIFPLTSGPYKL